MAEAKDIGSLHQPIKDYLRKQGVSLNPLTWYATWQLPTDRSKISSDAGNRRIFVLELSSTQFKLIKSADPKTTGKVYELRRKEGSGGPTPAAPRIELRRVKAELPEESSLTLTSAEDAPPKYFAQCRYLYSDGAPVSQSFTIKTTTNGELHGQLLGGDTSQLPLNGSGKLTYQSGSPIEREDWNQALNRIEETLDAIVIALQNSATISEIPSRIQNLHLIQLGLLSPAQPATMPTELFTDGYPVLTLAEQANELFSAGHHKPHIFAEKFRSLNTEPYQQHLALSFGLNETVIDRSACALAYFYVQVLASQKDCIRALKEALQPALEDGKSIEGASLELMLASLLCAKTPSNASERGNQNNHYALCRELGLALIELAQLAEQQSLYLIVSEQDSIPINATAVLPKPLVQWQPVPEPNWMELNYDDSVRPFPADTKLSYWLYDDADELLYEGDDLSPNQPKRFLLPNNVAEVSYHFAANLDPDLFNQLVSRFGQDVVQLFDVSPLMDREPGLSFTYPSSTGQNIILRPSEVALLQQAITALNLPVDEEGLALPNSYVILAASYTPAERIKQTIYQQFGNALNEDDWLLIEDQLALTSSSAPIVLDLTWLYADIVFRAAAERYDDPEVQTLVNKLETLIDEEPDLPKAPWFSLFAYASPSYQPTAEQGHKLKLGLVQSELKNRLDTLYEQQKDNGLIPYRQTFNEFLEWTNAILFGLATFFVPVEKWAIASGQAVLAVMRHKYFVGAAAAGALLYSGDAEAGKFKMPKLNIAKGAIRLTASKVLREQAENYGIMYKAVNSPSNIGLDGGVGQVKQLLIGKTPHQPLPTAPKGHHWFKQPDGSYNTKRNPNFDGPRKEFSADEGYFYTSSKTTTEGSNRAKAELGELKAHEFMIADGHTPVPGFKNPLYGHHGVDGLYFNGRPPPKYIVMEAKYHKSSYGWTKNDGKQMSDKWINKKLRNQLNRSDFVDFQNEDFLKIGLRYIPDIGKSVKEVITW